MKIWVDDIRQAPEGYVWCHSVNEVKMLIDELMAYEDGQLDELDFYHLDDYTPGPHILDLDHDAGTFAGDGGDYVNILNYLEFRAFHGSNINFDFHIHSFNPIGVVNMRAIIRHNNWKEIL